MIKQIVEVFTDLLKHIEGLEHIGSAAGAICGAWKLWDYATSKISASKNKQEHKIDKQPETEKLLANDPEY